MKVPDWIDREAYPFGPHRFQVPAGGMHYLDEGSGRAVVMVHGNPTWSFLYRDLIERLRAEYRCIAPDLIGFGLSDKPADWSYLPEDHAANLEALIEGLGLEDITLVLQDWGGPIGLAWAVEHPDKVAGIVVMNTWAWPVDRDLHFRVFSALMGGPIGRWLIRRYNVFARTLVRQAFGDKGRLSEAVHGHYIRPLADPRDRTGCMVFPRQIVAATPWLTRLWSRMPVLRDKPALLVWGMKDLAFRDRELRRWEGTFPRARAVRLAGVGHFVQEEAPDVLAEEVARFLAETASA